LNRQVEGVAPDALVALRRYPWPGNVRELQSVLKQSLLQATGPVLVSDFLPPHFLDLESRTDIREADSDFHWRQFIQEQIQAGSGNLYEESLRRMERPLLTNVLAHTGGNQVQAARLLGITRGSLRTKIRDLGITIGRTVSSVDNDYAVDSPDTDVAPS
jgi:two-component system nitrogen regulation response regulator GlnG